MIAVAHWVPFQVSLVVLLGWVVDGGRMHLCGHSILLVADLTLIHPLLQLLNNGNSLVHLLLGVYEDCTCVLRPFVVALLVRDSWIVEAEEVLNQSFEGHDGTVE